MMALVVMAVLALYLLIAALVVRGAARAARRRGIAGWKWGLPAALAMYLLLFWDHVPTLLAHRYYCQRHAGLTVHKTPEQWRAENPRIAATLSTNERSSLRQERGRRIYELNERFNWVIEGRRVATGLLSKVTQSVVDTATGEVLVARTDYMNRLKPLALGYLRPRDFRFWMDIKGCSTEPDKNKWLFEDKSFLMIANDFKLIGEKQE